MTGKQIKLFLVDGTAGGLTTAEITNWTGHVLAATLAHSEIHPGDDVRGQRRAVELESELL